MGWLDWAIDDPAPADQCGYAFLGIPRELTDLSLRRGDTIHSVEGWFSHITPSEFMRGRKKSWGVTIMRSGQVWKHRPRPTFVNWHAGGPAQNVGTDGIEMEGKDQPWTPEQRASLVRVLRETWEWFGWPTYTLAGPTGRTQELIRLLLQSWGYGSLWEHNWFDYTTCPSGRNDWAWLMPALEEGEDMATPQEHEDWLARIQAWLEAHDNDAHADVNARIAANKKQGDDHQGFHDKPLDPSIRDLQLEMETVLGTLDALSAGDGIKRGDTVSAKIEIL